ncbi:hypothetical protein [Sphaerochaeta sp. S2]|uniref:hypothetical protein n=1 Tax=Sphaerochaeta sp. S2 TaxID=2798868 RepID=UPI0018E9BB46|nr:hypothetical protein [Sphaerochaeta sp. S2]MBJ2357373.1 hypothetical protein [Sphaerochaeta sp. S2]MCK9348802.1 hypothetical protein [Sphaerochaeta sp.]MDD4301839.1 hypothetical protein [Sphaerochaeta sp.]MDY0243732.1 hypothetical protein [Sphaerochaeta sp.]
MELHIKVDFAEGATFAYLGVEGVCKVHDTREKPEVISISSSIVATSRRGSLGL